MLELWQPEKQATRNEMTPPVLMANLAMIKTKDWNSGRFVRAINHLTDEDYNEKLQHQYPDLNPAGNFAMDYWR
jgi:hypothetical protein